MKAVIIACIALAVLVFVASAGRENGAAAHSSAVFSSPLSSPQKRLQRDRLNGRTHPHVSLDELQRIEQKIRKQLSSMTPLQKARQLDMYSGSELLSHGAVNKAKLAELLKDGIGIVHDWYPLTADILNEVQNMAMDPSNNVQIPVLPVEECLHGLLQKDHTIFPHSISMAASFNPDLLQAVGQAIGLEARAFGIRQCLSPVLGISREPRWGRQEETYGEDMHLTSVLAYAYITGMQLQGGSELSNNTVTAEPKHYAVHSVSNGGRNTGPAMIGRRETESVFLRPFAAAIADAGALSVMSAYSELDGVPCCGNPYLLNETLRTNWGFPGYVLSDLGAIKMMWVTHHITDSAVGAITRYLESGGNAQFYDFDHDTFQQSIVAAVGNGTLSEAVLDERVADILRVKSLLQLDTNPTTDPSWIDRYVNSEEHRNLSLLASLQSLILLKNDNNLLPLAADTPAIAVIGQTPYMTAYSLCDYSGGGGNVNNFNAYSFIRGVKNVTSAKIFSAWGTGILYDTEFEPIHTSHLFQGPSPTSDHGVIAEYFDNTNLTGSPSLQRVDAEINFQWYHNGYNSTYGSDAFSARYTTYLIPDLTVKAGLFYLDPGTNGGARLFVDDQLIIDSWAGGTQNASFSFQNGQVYAVVVEYFTTAGDSNIVLSWNLVGSQGFEDALNAAKAAGAAGGVAVVVVGDAANSCGEGVDRGTLNLPGKQLQLAEAVIALGVPTVIVLTSGRAVSIPTLADPASGAHAILHAYTGGQAQGLAIAKALFGEYSPAGRLPVSLPYEVGQLPVYYNYKPSDQGRYADNWQGQAGSQTGQYMDKTPLFPFGFGLSYTTFQYSNLVIEPSVIVPSQSTLLQVTVTVMNVGSVASDEVIQVYGTDDVSSVTTPVIQLIAFGRVSVAPSESVAVTFDIDVESVFSLYNMQNQWALEPGSFTIRVGASSADIRLQGTFTVSATAPKLEL